MNDRKLIQFSEVFLSEVKQSKVFMQIKARLFVAKILNKNGVEVTEEFIDRIIANSSDYEGLPLYVDLETLYNLGYLTHQYDPYSGEFGTVQIGSFYKFEKEDFNGNPALIAYCKVPKRNKNIRKSIAALFCEEGLKFSFEIAVGDVAYAGEDNHLVIDASDANTLEGVAVVTDPAYEDAVALDLVAERRIDMDTNKEEVIESVSEVTSEPETTEEVSTAETEQETEEIVQEVEDAAEEVASISDIQKLVDSVNALAEYIQRIDEKLADFQKRIEIAEEEREVQTDESIETVVVEDAGTMITSELKIPASKYDLLEPARAKYDGEYSLLK